MTTLLDRHRTAVAAQLDAIEQTKAYEAARDGEEGAANGEFAERRGLVESWIALCTLTFALASNLNREWRRRIFRGVETLGPGESDAMRALFERWDRVCNNEPVRQRLQEFEASLAAHGEKLRGVEEYRACCQQVGEVLAGWAAPVVSKAVALQEGELSEEDVSRLEALAQSGAARAKGEPRRIR